MLQQFQVLDLLLLLLYQLSERLLLVIRNLNLIVRFLHLKFLQLILILLHLVRVLVRAYESPLT